MIAIRINIINMFSHLTFNTPSYKLQIMNKTLAERLSYAMQLKGISQGALASEVGVAQPTIWRLVSGKAKGSTRLVDIARALSVNADWLANGRGSIQPEEMMSYPHSPDDKMAMGGVFPVQIYDKETPQHDDFIYVPKSVESDSCRAYILERSSGCSEAPAGTIIVVDINERPGNGDLIYALVNSFYSVYRFVEGGSYGFLSVDDNRVPLIPLESASLVGVIVFLLRDLKRKK